ncbi:hypothetical protein NLU14_14195 [Marinobacter sp. 71-i]|uniref:Chlorhexidine efflux transporter domain-containing protein n=1 Tax=Marinobacter iranensis TaxID=2962607 RepID=A0ABT5YCH0_9GAMM|nr:hypothetical protein [Marinobacter iranensis]MDF0751373.1 hypothetical protein [Marinobacter iranensis]
MSEENGSARNRFQSHVIIEMLLVVALAAYMLVARSEMVGDDFSFTVIGAVLMALVTYWTLNTLRDGLEVIALRVRRSRH